ncbi:MAG: hypothetical protein ACP5TV_03255 [Anaerolineae bacterium]
MKVLKRRMPVLAWWVVIWLSILLLGSIAPAWARPGQQPAYQTVPTLPPTRRPATPTPPPPPVGTAAPSPAPTTTPAIPHLQVEWRAGTAAAVPGGQFTYELRVTNAGTEQAEQLEVRLVLSAQVTPKDVRLSAGQYEIDPNHTILARLESLPAGQSWIITAVVVVDPSAPPGTVLEAWAEVRLAGAVWRPPAAAVALPPAELPPTGGKRPGR